MKTFTLNETAIAQFRKEWETMHAAIDKRNRESGNLQSTRKGRVSTDKFTGSALTDKEKAVDAKKAALDAFEKFIVSSPFVDLVVVDDHKREDVKTPAKA